MAFATIGGQRIHYTVRGDGPLVVLQHGFLADGTAWRATGEAVASLTCPVLLWNGEDDAYAAPMAAFAEDHGLPFLATRGDHGGAIGHYADEALVGLEAFLGGMARS